MESDTTTSPLPPAAGTVPARLLSYAPPRRGARLRRWLGPGALGFWVLVLLAAGAAAWGARKWMLRADERAFNERARTDSVGRATFSKPPDAASLRHLSRRADTWMVDFDLSGSADPAAPR